MIKHNKKIGIFIDTRKKSGGAYQELLYNIRNIKKYNKENFKFSLICASKKLDLKLESENIEIHYLSMNVIERYICYLRNFGSFALPKEIILLSELPKTRSGKILRRILVLTQKKFKTRY